MPKLNPRDSSLPVSRASTIAVPDDGVAHCLEDLRVRSLSGFKRLVWAEEGWVVA